MDRDFFSENILHSLSGSKLKVKEMQIYCRINNEKSLTISFPVEGNQGTTLLIEVSSQRGEKSFQHCGSLHIFLLVSVVDVRNLYDVGVEVYLRIVVLVSFFD